MSTSCSVTGPPAIPSALTILVCPTFAHSARIWRMVTSFAFTVTRPSCIVTCSSALAGVAAARIAAAARARTATRIGPISIPPALLAPEIVDHLGQDVVEVVLRFIADERFDLAQIRHAARHVFEARLVRLVVGDQLDRRLRDTKL